MSPVAVRRPFSSSPEKEPPQKSSGFDLVTRLLPLVIAFLATLQEQRARFWGLLAFAFFWLVIGFYRPFKEQIRYRIYKLRDERVARQAFRELKRFLRAFGEFVDLPTSHASTIHHIALHDLCGSNTGNFERLRLAPTNPFKQWCYYLTSRIQNVNPNLTNIVETVREFSSIIGDYTHYCVLPIFERFPQELRPLLTDTAKSSLEAFRQRFDRFLHDYSEYLKSLDESFTTPRIQSYYFARPKPL